MKRSYKKRENFTIKCIKCGSEVITNSYRTLRCKSCRVSADWYNNYENYQWRLGKLVGAAKKRATDKQLPFNITKEYLIKLWDENKGRCEVSNREFDLSHWGEKSQVNPNAPSVDRINPKLGYVEGNIRLVTYHVNVALSEFGLDALLGLIKDINEVAFR